MTRPPMAHRRRGRRALWTLVEMPDNCAEDILACAIAAVAILVACVLAGGVG